MHCMPPSNGEGCGQGKGKGRAYQLRQLTLLDLHSITNQRERHHAGWGAIVNQAGLSCA